MSLMAGFDVIIEVSHDALLKLVKSNLKIGGVFANPPFGFTLPFSSAGANGTMHVIVTDLKLDVNADDTVTLIFEFDNNSGTSVTLNSPLQKTVSVLGGSLAIKAPIVLQPAAVPAGGGTQQPSVNLKQGTVTVKFNLKSKTKIQNVVAGSSLTYTNLRNAIKNALTAALKKLTLSIPISKGLSVLPNVQGTLNPLRFERLELHCIGTQSWGLFGMLFPQKPKGDNVQKMTTAITGTHELCMSISPDTFHRLSFCKALVATLGANTISDLPGSCGPASGISTEGVTVTSVSDSFAQGHINIDGSIEDSGVCYEAHGTFHGEITFSVSGTTLEPKLWLAEPDVDVDVPWYCGPVQLVFELFGFLQNIINNAIFEAIAADIAESAVESITNKGLASQNIGAISNATYDQVSITPEGLTLNGTASIVMPLPQAKKIELSGSVTTSSTEVLSTGTYLAILPLCGPEEFPYTEYAQQQTATYQVLPTLLGLPLRMVWSIIPGDGTSPIPLGNDPTVPTEGTKTIPGQTVTYALGSIVTDLDLHLGFSTFGNMIQLTNTPEEGNYIFTLRVKVQDSIGTLMEANTYVQFEGNAVVIGGGYLEFVARCMQIWGEFLDRYKPIDRYVPPWVPVNYPSPETLVAYIRGVLSSGSPEALAALSQTKLVHGASFLRALSPPQEIKPSYALEQERQ